MDCTGRETESRHWPKAGDARHGPRRGSACKYDCVIYPALLAGVPAGVYLDELDVRRGKATAC